MTPTSSAITVLTNLGAQFPTIAVCFLGVILALVHSQRQPRVAAMVAAALGFLLVVSFAQPLLQPAISNMIFRQMRGGMNFQSPSLFLAGVGFFFNFLRAIALGVLAYAAFVDRPVPAFYGSVPPPKGYPLGPLPQPRTSSAAQDETAPASPAR
jgi:hypothetical protein